MEDNYYEFVDRWRLSAKIDEVSTILEDAASLVRWWPSVYLSYREIRPARTGGLGRIVQFRAKGFLPYTLTINFETTESNYPNGFTLNATGDLEGTGIWSFKQAGDFVDVTYDWKVKANKGIVSTLSFILKPIFAANHRWTMARGEESLHLELLRRHAETPAALSKIPPPPGPIFPHNLKFFQSRMHLKPAFDE